METQNYITFTEKQYFFIGLATLGSIFICILFMIALFTKKKGEKWLFGTTNLRWGIKELIMMYSNKPSFFSKKRINSGVAFIVCMHGSLLTLVTIVHTIEDFAIWFSVHQPIIFWLTYKTQQEKKDLKDNPPIIKEIINEVKGDG